MPTSDSDWQKAFGTARKSADCPEEETLLPINEDEEEDSITNNLTDPCARDIFNELSEGNFKDDIIKPEIQVPNEYMTLNFSEVVYKMFNDLEYVDYKVQNGPLPGRNGLTQIYSGNIVTTISDTFIENGTKLAIARTMIHEAVHAYIVYKNNSLDTEFRNAIELYGKQNGYDIDQDPNRFHHEFMGQYVNAMAFSLYEWDKEHGSGGNLGWDYYYAMAFGGLYYKDSNNNIIETDSFKTLVPDSNERLKIRNILINEQDGNSKAKSPKC